MSTEQAEVPPRNNGEWRCWHQTFRGTLVGSKGLRNRQAYSRPSSCPLVSLVLGDAARSLPRPKQFQWRLVETKKDRRKPLCNLDLLQKKELKPLRTTPRRSNFKHTPTCDTSVFSRLRVRMNRLPPPRHLPTSTARTTCARLISQCQALPRQPAAQRMGSSAGRRGQS